LPEAAHKTNFFAREFTEDDAMRLVTGSLLAAVLSFGIANAADVPANWVDVAAGPMFNMKAPPGTTFERTRLGDVFCRTIYVAGGSDFLDEFGDHREDLKNPNGAQNAAVQKMMIDAKPGSIITATMSGAAPRFVGLHVPSVENDVLGPLSLVINAQVAKPEDEATIKQIYESITFEYKN